VPKDEMLTAAERIFDDLVRWRRELHRRPELGFEERETAAFVSGHLEDLELEIHSGIAQTGVAAVLRAPSAKEPAVLLRADMDGLPIQEVAGREYGSNVAGLMHACGHDGHVAMLLGAARLLAERRDDLVRDVLFCFQPAEESRGGAEAMIRDGVLELVEIGAVYGLHLWSQEQTGTVLVRPGPAMAAADEFTADVVGQGGHGAMPQAARDPIVAAAQAVVALQSIVARGVDPGEPAVVTVGAINGGSATNIIPERVNLRGTLRSYSGEVRQFLQRRVEEVLRSTAEAAGCRSEFEIGAGFPVLVNDPAAVEHVRREAARLLGEDNVRDPGLMPVSEDFACFLEKRPGAFALLGAGNSATGMTAPHHSPDFDFDEAALALGAALLARLAL
jgi:amidohydrolase